MHTKLTGNVFNILSSTPNMSTIWQVKFIYFPGQRMKCYAVVDPRKSESPPPPLPLHSAQVELDRVKRPKGLFRVSSARSCAAEAGQTQQEHAVS